MFTKVTIELLKDTLESQNEWLKSQNKWVIDSKKSFEDFQKGRNKTLKYMEELENDIKAIQEEGAK